MRRRNIIIPDEAIDDFTTFYTLPRPVLEAMADRLSNGIYNLNEMIIDIINDTGVKDDDAFSALAVICYLNAAVEERNIPPEDLMSEVLGRMEGADVHQDRMQAVLESAESNKDLFLRMLSENVRRPIEEKKTQLERGIHNIAVDFRSICDIRPVFDEPAERIESHVVVMLLDVTVEDENQEQEHIVISMNDRSLEQLEEVILRARKKMDRLMNVRVEVD